MHEWVQEHQNRLQVAFSGAQERLKVMAEKRKVKHDQCIHDIPLAEGRLVYLRDCGNRGHHKIQDLWSPVVYQVVRVPPAGGVVYSIVPVDDLSKVKIVHRSLLKSRIQRCSVSGAPVQELVEAPKAVLPEEEEEVDLACVIPAGGHVVPSVVSEVVVVPLQTSPQLSGTSVDSGRGPVNSFESGVDVHPLPVGVPVSVEEREGGDISLRRTGRVTAGRHPNPYHLPCTAGVSLFAPSVSNSVTAIFRPWN